MPTEDQDAPADDIAARDLRARPHEIGQQAVVSSETLFQGAQELLIQHNDQIYRLRQTRNGKLILNK